MMRGLPRWLWCLAISLLWPGAPVSAASVSEVHYVMGTYLTVTVDGMAAPIAHQQMRKCFAEVRRLDAIFSRYAADSELNRINAQSGQSAVVVSDDVARLLRLSLTLKDASDGRFDVSIGAMTSPPLATAASVRNAAGRVPAAVSLSPDPCSRAGGSCTSTLRLDRHAQLDFDGIAKGYAVDRCAAILRGGGVGRALINFGESSQYAIGAPHGQAGWPLELRSLETGKTAARLRLRDEALSVSSVMVERDGVVRSHIVDPRTGSRAASPAIVAVVADSGAVAEAWSKALLLPGNDAPGSHAPGTSGYRGALRIRGRRIERLGRIDATIYRHPRLISPAAEVLR